MSKLDSATVTCPDCKDTFPVTYWGSVNVTLNPELRERVLSGDIRKHACPKCRQQLTIDSDLVYHDMKRKFMICYQVQKDGHSRPIDSRVLEATPASMAEYQLRFVGSWNQLREKVAIFEACLDDNHIELIKLFVANKVYGDVNFGDDCIYFLEKREKLSGNGEISFEVYKDGKLFAACQYPLAEYNKVAKQAHQQLGNNYGAGEWKTVNQVSMRPNQELRPDYNRDLDLIHQGGESKEQPKQAVSPAKVAEGTTAMISKDEFIRRAKIDPQQRSWIDANWEAAVRATGILKSQMPSIGILSERKRIGCFLAVCDHIDRLKDSGQLTFDAASLAVIILRETSTDFSKAYALFWTRAPTYSWQQVKDFPNTALEFFKAARGQ